MILHVFKSFELIILHVFKSFELRNSHVFKSFGRNLGFIQCEVLVKRPSLH